MHQNALLVFLFCASVFAAPQQPREVLRPVDVFELEFASDPRISPDGKWVAYLRNAMDIQKDRPRTELWLASVDGRWHRALAAGTGSVSTPRWSPDGTRLIWVRSNDGTHEIRHRWMDDGSESSLATLKKKPSGLTWSPDGKQIAFSRFVPTQRPSFVEMPAAPAGAEWAPRPKVVDKVRWRDDGGGLTGDGHHHLFALTSEGGTPRQLTRGAFHHKGPVSWSADGEYLCFSADLSGRRETEPSNPEVQELHVASGKVRALTKRRGPDRSPVVSPDGKWIAYLGYEDRFHGYQVTELWVMGRDGTDPRALTSGLDRSVRAPRWAPDGKTVWFLFDDEGSTKIGRVDLEGKVETLASDVGGTSLGRPYASGAFTVGPGGAFAYTSTTPARPADVSLGSPGKKTQVLTRLNEDFLWHRRLGAVEEMWAESSHDGRRIQSWIVTPPDFDPKRRYPMILEIHGGPFANYGPRFTTEIQLYAAAGYVVLYVNPRGSTSYGKEFGNLIHHAYPGHDYDDLISCVDALLERGYVDSERLFITGGSGGGVLTAWTVAKTDRFRAAVSAKPVINWYSFVLTADHYPFFARYWFPGPPWEHAEHYLKRSPIHHAGKIKTPTMLLTGEADWRTPISESEQLYQALKLRGVDTMLVRFPEASHNIAARPSHLIAKVAHILAWFQRYDAVEDVDGRGALGRFDYDESDLLPGRTLVERLAHVSQLDRLAETKADYARCSCAATLSAYLLLGGEFAPLARQLGVGQAMTFGNVHRVQEKLYLAADQDGRPGIFGTAKPLYDADGNLTGWERRPEDEYHRVIEALGLTMERIYAPTKAEPMEKRAAIEACLARPSDVVFIVGVMEDTKKERFTPMRDKATGNHYVAIFRRGNDFFALDSYRTPGRTALVKLTDEAVDANLMRTHNAIYAVRRNK